MGRFKKGLFIGGLLGAGFMWMSVTKKGKETREKLIDQAADIYDDIKEKVMSSDEWKNMTKSQYVKLVRESADKYLVNNDNARKAKDIIVKIVSAQYKNLKKEIGSKCRGNKGKSCCGKG